MTTTEYLIIFESIIYGIVVTQIIIGWGRMIQQRGTYKSYWAHTLFTVMFFLVAVQNFYSAQDLASYEFVFNSLSFLGFIVIAPTVVSVIIFLLLPENLEGIDFRELILKEFIPISIAILVYFISTVIGNILQFGFTPFMWLPHIIMAIFYIAVLITRKLWVFELLVILSLVLIGTFLWFR